MMFGIRKAVEETVQVSGERNTWIDRCEGALIAQKFKKVKVDRTLGQVTGNFHPMFGYGPWGNIVLTFAQEGGNTSIHIWATADADNVQSLVRSPAGRIIEKFKLGLGTIERLPVPKAEPPDSSVVQVIERLAALHDAGALDDDEFKAAKTKLLE
jgi:hypothetical protein